MAMAVMKLDECSIRRAGMATHSAAHPMPSTSLAAKSCIGDDANAQQKLPKETDNMPPYLGRGRGGGEWGVSRSGDSSRREWTA